MAYIERQFWVSGSLFVSVLLPNGIFFNHNFRNWGRRKKKSCRTKKKNLVPLFLRSMVKLIAGVLFFIFN